MAIEVFNRYENKYLIDQDVFYRLRKYILEHMHPDFYNQDNKTYKITNLYYDTLDNEFIKNSLSKPKYKEKIRVRAYGVPDMDSKVFVEIKKKVCGLVNKRRSEMLLSEAYDFLKYGFVKKIRPYMNEQVINEIKFVIGSYDIIPALYLSYDRYAYFDDADLRVSFDKNILTRRFDLRLESGSYGEKLLENGKILMEIKVKDSIPIWLSRILSEYKIYPTSFSKYGTEYKNLIKESKIYYFYKNYDYVNNYILQNL